MTQLPDVDVILLSWNRSKMTLETVHNLLEQQGVNLKIWIVDQGSRPDELQFLRDSTKDFSNVQITALEKNVGVPAGRNIGTQLGKAPYTVSLDNDAIFESSNALKETVEIFEQNPKIGAISFRINNFYTNQDDELSWVYPKSLKLMKDQKFFTTRFVGCGHAIRRDVFEKAGGYDGDLFFCWEEIDISYRIINLGYEILYNPEISVLHKVAPEARVRWKDKRFYFQVRNALYSNFKYNQDLGQSSLLATGYIIRGCFNQVPLQAIQGIIHAVKMCQKTRIEPHNCSLKLTEAARSYLWEYEIKYRGTLWNRIKQEVLAKLPGSS